MKNLLLGFFLLATSAASAITNDELLDAKEAFPASARAVGPNMVEITFKIADGYYLYRNKLHFAAIADTARVGSPALPKGMIKKDEFFGKVEIYRGTLKIRLPVEQAGGKIGLKVQSQGCADIGVCYPAFEQTLAVELPGA